MINCSGMLKNIVQAMKTKGSDKNRVTLKTTYEKTVPQSYFK